MNTPNDDKLEREAQAQSRRNHDAHITSASPTE